MFQLIFQSIEIPCSFERDFIVIIRFLVAFMNFYLAYLIGKKITEAGSVSATTGMMLYLFGNGLFQVGITSEVLYSAWNYTRIVYSIGFTFYFIAMASFAIFAEMDLVRHEKTQEKKGFSYKWSVVSLIGIVFFLPLGIINLEFFSYGFIYLLIPFIAASGLFFDRFKNLEMLKKSRPNFWFTTGLAIAGLSNFIFSFLLPVIVLLIIQTILAIGGSLSMVKGWSALPHLGELTWYLKLGKVMVLLREGLAVFHYAFQAEPVEGGGADSDLAGGALSGVQSILSEILKSKEGINEIDHGDKTIYFVHGKFASYILFTVGKGTEFVERLAMFGNRFEQKFNKELVGWNGNINLFSKADDLIKEIFKP